MQDLLEVNGIVLSSMPIGEADRRILMLTKELGKISAFVRGARRPTSMMVGTTRPFACGTFYLNPGRDSYSVNKAEIRDYFETVSEDIGKTAYGCYFMELAGYFTHENAPAKDELTLLYYSLKALQNEHIPDALVRRVFELKMQGIAGVVPDFRLCAYCRKTPEEGWFLPSLMNLVCDECNPGGKGTRLSKGTLRALRFIAATPAEKLFTFSVSDEMLAALSEVSERLIEKNVDRTLNSRELLSVLV